MSVQRCRRARRCRRTIAALIVAVSWSSGCALPYAPMVAIAREAPALTCRVPIGPDGTTGAWPITWLRASRADDGARHDRWCEAIGPPVVVVEPVVTESARTTLPLDAAFAVVSWNVHVGSGDVIELVRRLRAGTLTGGEPITRFVLLLQEAYRAGDAMPATVPTGLRSPGAQGHRGPAARRLDVVQLSRTLGLSLFYAPSMRNGGPPAVAEDRGNAILSTEPLSELTAVELPFARQRRVAIVATVSGHRSAGQPWSLRVANVHLESTVAARRLWILASSARVRQATALLEVLTPFQSLVVGGDFNTWFGYADRTYRTMAAALTDATVVDRRRTFARIFRLDHVFAMPPPGWRIAAVRLDDRLGSDHYPILARIRVDEGK